jgi:hypothetical protein
MLNPYASFLGSGDPQPVIRSTPLRLAELGAQPVGAPPAGKWGIREIACHLADCEIAFAFRLRQAAAETNHTIQPFDQDAWAIPYEKLELAQAIEVFRALRLWNLKFLAALPEETFDRPVTHPERGAMTFRTIVETMAGHDLNHLAQIERLG